MKNFRYKKYIPNDLGKIIYFEDLIPKKVLRQKLSSNLIIQRQNRHLRLHRADFDEQ